MSQLVGSQDNPVAEVRCVPGFRQTPLEGQLVADPVEVGAADDWWREVPPGHQVSHIPRDARRIIESPHTAKSWGRGRENTVVLKFVKMVFDGGTNDHVGYLVVEATARIEGDEFTNLESDVNILIGPDLSNPLSVIPLGPTDAVGRRITVG